MSSSGDALQPIAAEQPTEVATAQLRDEQEQSSENSRDEHSAAVVPSPTTSNAQLDVHTAEAASDKPKPAVKRRHRKARPRNVRAGRIEKKKRARRQRREAAARAQQGQQRNTPSGCPVAAAEHSERAEEEEEQAQRGDFNDNSNAHPASEPKPSLPGSNRQCWQQPPRSAPRYSPPPPPVHPRGQQPPPPQQYFVPGPSMAPLMWPDIYFGTISQLRAVGMYRELSMFICTSHQIFSTSAMYGSQYYPGPQSPIYAY